MWKKYCHYFNNIICILQTKYENAEYFYLSLYNLPVFFFKCHCVFFFFFYFVAEVYCEPEEGALELAWGMKHIVTLANNPKSVEDIHHHIFSYIIQMFVIMSITTLKSLLSHTICKFHNGTLRKSINIFWISGWEKVPKPLINWLLMKPSVWWLFVITQIAIAANNAPSIQWQDYLSSLLKCVWINTKAVFQSCWRKRIIRSFFSLCRERLTALDWCYSGKTALMSLHPGVLAVSKDQNFCHTRLEK